MMEPTRMVMWIGSLPHIPHPQMRATMSLLTDPHHENLHPKQYLHHRSKTWSGTSTRTSLLHRYWPLHPPCLPGIDQPWKTSEDANWKSHQCPLRLAIQEDSGKGRPRKHGDVDHARTFDKQSTHSSRHPETPRRNEHPPAERRLVGTRRMTRWFQEGSTIDHRCWIRTR